MLALQEKRICFSAFVMTLLSDQSVGRSVKLLLALASTFIPGFSLLEIHDQDLFSLLDMHVFQNGAFSSAKEGSVFYEGTTFVAS
jgi:flagellar biosynthesis protein FliR